MRSILIIAPNWIGDAVMTQPLLASLKALYPESKIDVLASSWVAPIYRACSEVHEVIEAKFEHKKLQWGMRKQLAQKLAAKHYQACFVLPNSFKSALIPWLANIPFRIGYRGELRYGLINLSLDNPSKVNRPPMVDHYLALNQLLSDHSEKIATDPPAPKLNVSALAKRVVENNLAAANIAGSIYVMCPGAEYGPTKRWPTEHFAKLAQSLIDDNSDNHVILLGSKSDSVLAQEILSQVPSSRKLHNWCGKTSLDEAIALISLSQAVVSNDSGLMHIAAALKAPQVAIFGSSDPSHTPPLSEKAKVIWLNLPCSPCHKRECPLGHLKCLKDILPEQVLATLNTLH
ncbi:lipopolysaccharide heptosyltransferase II [Polynucleobacter sp. AP-Kolm-20A-A1]|uniref:lipopolysaccharide heptosyltransferase II n=1 Tax=Polynucleobacter sp. AP-Kolm-20A-A1 TaxID=2081041 RepID=UPI001BFD8419|nr:lipopolysaccharide heptosyltransferase II [Polynucleobacter sp. AP-Kolm-20A-A1]QWE20402.1 lipopolysaccharide heptosyltransferase II [Polynucleobacter sp. AP-Kolm-20A-A1]